MLVLFVIAVFSFIGLTAYLILLQDAVNKIHQLYPEDTMYIDTLPELKESKISVIIPAYNEANNIRDCIQSILCSTNLSSANMEVWVVDDQSTDNTLTIIKTLQQELRDPRLKIMSGLPRPKNVKWVGKNWACVQAVQVSIGDFLLFIDADVRLKQGAIDGAVKTAVIEKIDLLNCLPKVVCVSLAEYLIQPLMFINLLVSLNYKEAKDPKTKTAFAAGPFLLFRRSAYESIGGHQAVAHEVAEDVALARLIKHNRFKLGHYLGAKVATLRMYQSWSALWEGWTKVLYVGAQRNWLVMLYLAIVMLLIYLVPWLGLITLTIHSLIFGWHGIDFLIIFIVLIAIFMQYKLRTLFNEALNCNSNYWWLQGLGGLLVAAMALVSVIKVETGWRWTWKGRSLSSLILLLLQNH
jgi:glycosyltransferase involved in cell wall biosynthesis